MPTLEANLEVGATTWIVCIGTIALSVLGIDNIVPDRVPVIVCARLDALGAHCKSCCGVGPACNKPVIDVIANCLGISPSARIVAIQPIIPNAELPHLTNGTLADTGRRIGNLTIGANTCICRRVPYAIGLAHAFRGCVDPYLVGLALAYALSVDCPRPAALALAIDALVERRLGCTRHDDLFARTDALLGIHVIAVAVIHDVVLECRRVIVCPSKSTKGEHGVDDAVLCGRVAVVVIGAWCIGLFLQCR